MTWLLYSNALMPPAATPASLFRHFARYARPGVPKYVAMREAIAHAIASGECAANARLPTESEVAAALPLSLGTIQRALRALADEGVITRRQGQGSFVAAAPAAGQMRAPLHCRFVNDDGTGYLPVYPSVLARFEEEREGPWRAHLRARRIACIERVFRIADEFRVFGRFWFDPARLPSLHALPLRKLSGENFKDLIWRDTRQSVGPLDRTLSQVTLPPEAARALRAPRGARGQHLEVAACVGRDSPIYYQELYIPNNRRRLHLAPDGRDPGLGAAAPER